MNPLGKAKANDTMAASSPSLASAVLMRRTLAMLRRCSTASSKTFAEHPDDESYSLNFWQESLTVNKPDSL